MAREKVLVGRTERDTAHDREVSIDRVRCVLDLRCAVRDVVPWF